MRDFTGSCAVVTGGGGLLGRGMAVTFAKAGMDVVVSDINGDSARAVADAVNATGRRGVAVQTDVADLASVQQLADIAYREFGSVQLLCNNAGISRMNNFEDLTIDDWRMVLGVNLDGVLHGVIAFLPRLLEQTGWRHILNTSSMSGIGRGDLRVGIAPYVTSKFAVVGLSETMAPALADKGIGVSVLCPGRAVDFSKPIEFRNASGRWYKDNLLTPEQVADEVLRGIDENRLHIFPHHAGESEMAIRHERVVESFRQASAGRKALGLDW